MKIRRICLVIGRTVILSICILLFLAGCGKIKDPPKISKEENSGQKTKLTIYYSSDDTNELAEIEYLCERFMEDYNEIEIDMEPSVKGIYSESLKIKEALGEMPDICQIQNPYTFVEADKLGEIPVQVSNLIKNPKKVNGKVYAVPMYTTTYGIIYNKVIFNKYHLLPPKNYDEFLDICNKLYKNGEIPLALGGSKSDKLSYWFNYFYQIDVADQISGWQKLRTEKKVRFTDDLTKKMMKDYTDLLNSSYVLEDSINMNDNQVVTNLVQGNAVMIYTGPWMFSQIVAADLQATDFYEVNTKEPIKDGSFRLGFFFLPDRAGNEVAMEIITKQWAVSKECSENKDKLAAAALFLKYFYKKDNYRSVLKSLNALPTTKEAILYPMIGAQQKLIVKYRYADNSNHYLGNYATPEDFEGILYRTLNSVLTDTISENTALKRLDEEWDTLLAGMDDVEE